LSILPHLKIEKLRYARQNNLLLRVILNHNLQGEITTATKASSKFASLRTTIPMSVVKQWKLKEGSKLDWEWKVQNGEMILIVKKVK
jgi:hypothetical protein